MDYGYTPQQESLRQEVRQFIADNVTTDVVHEMDDLESGQGTGKRGRGPLVSALFKKIGERKWLGIAWPKEYGGQGNPDIMRQTIVNEELVLARAPGLIGASGLTMLGPTLLQVGSEEQKRRYLPEVLTAEEI